MPTAENFPSELRVLLNHIYEYQKGVRNLILYTMPVKYKDRKSTMPSKMSTSRNSTSISDVKNASRPSSL